MKKRDMELLKKGLWFIVILIVLFILFSDSPDETLKNEKGDSFSETGYAHWGHMPITYTIEGQDICGMDVESRMEWAFEMMKNETGGLVYFKEANANPDIEIRCRDSSEEKKALVGDYVCVDVEINPEEVEGHPSNHLRPKVFTMIQDGSYIHQTTSEISEDGIYTYEICAYNNSEAEEIFSHNPSKLGHSYISDIEGNKILHNEINFFNRFTMTTTCPDFPTKEIHELLHSFGFDHIVEGKYNPYFGEGFINETTRFKYKGDILYPELQCPYQQEFNEHYVSCLKYIYSNGEQGDCDGVVFQ